MTGTSATVVAVVLLVAVLVVAVLRPGGLPEATAAVPAAVLVLVLGLVSPAAALEEVARLGPTVGFLAAVLVLAHLADAEGVFRWAGGLLAARSRGLPRRLFALVFTVAAVTTAVLSLDATVVLLTPVVLVTARRLRVRPAPHAYACAHLANSASLLLPVSNLTNLLALDATGLSFLGFAALMALPQAAVLAVEYAGLRLGFRRELAGAPAPCRVDGPDAIDGLDRAAGPGGRTGAAGPAVPVVALGILAATLVGFSVASPLGVAPAWVAVAGALVLGVRSVAARRTRWPAVLAATSPLFCLFVLALGVVVAAVTTHGLGALAADVLPDGESWATLLALAAVAAVLANLVNNLPATLVLLTALGPTPAVGAVLAVLIGVNVGPNLTYVGSLATLLWRRVLRADGESPRPAQFTGIGLLTVPLGLVAGTTALWAGLALR